MWKVLREDHRPGSSDLFVESGMLALHPERRRKIGHQGVQATADLVRRITSTEVTTENQNIILNSCQPISVWSYDMDGHAEKGSKGTASLLKNSIGIEASGSTVHGWMIIDVHWKMSLV